MATDVPKIIQNLLAVYDSSGRTIIVVGAGSGQFIEYGRRAAQILALDSDAEAIRLLRENLKKAGLEDRVTPILGDFYESVLKGDAVLFEFCLHEMSDPQAAIRHAQTMAPDIVIIDHWPDSEWSYYTAEAEKVRVSWEALESFPLRKKQSYGAVNFFNDYDELYLKLKVQGELSLARIEKFRSKKNIAIPISYGIALIQG
ncbi:MAG: methyltransferase domain-containing protein [Candidatus Aminicenantales bacterium]